MTQDEMAKWMQLIFEDCARVREQEQKEYAINSDNAFRNFNKLSEDLGIDRKFVLFIYFKKHIDGILSYIKGHKSQREDVRCRIKDAIVYLCLLQGMIEEDEEITRTIYPGKVFNPNTVQEFPKPDAE